MKPHSEKINNLAEPSRRVARFLHDQQSLRAVLENELSLAGGTIDADGVELLKEMTKAWKTQLMELADYFSVEHSHEHTFKVVAS